MVAARHASAGDVGALRLLVEGKADCTVKDKAGNTALHYTSDVEDVTGVLELLIAHGKADPFAVNNKGAKPLLPSRGLPSAVSRYESLALGGWSALTPTVAYEGSYGVRGAHVCEHCGAFYSTREGNRVAAIVSPTDWPPPLTEPDYGPL